MNKIIYGTYDLNKDKMKEAVRTVIESGYDSIDTAWLYNVEKELGIVLKELKEEGLKMLPLQGKVHPLQMDVQSTRESLMNTLQDLQIDKIEYYMIHRPHYDMNKNVAVWKDLIELQKEGLIDHIGVSNFDNDMISILIQETGVKPEYNQIEASVQCMRWDRIHYGNKNGVDLQGWSVMGDLSVNLKDKTIVKIAKAHKVDPSIILIAFPLAVGIDSIVKSGTPSRIKGNLEARNIKFTEQELNELKALNIFKNKFEETFGWRK